MMQILMHIYLLPIAAICLFVWLIWSDMILIGVIYYVLVGIYESFFRVKEIGEVYKGKLFLAVSAVLLWPFIAIFSFFSAKKVLKA